MGRKIRIFFFVFLFFALLLRFNQAQASEIVLKVSPSVGKFFVGSVFSVSLVLDTKGKSINTVDINLKFPPSLLQVDSPIAGVSFVADWTIPPSYSNTSGIISFKGGIPQGIITSSGVIATINFRTKSVGQAKIDFFDSSVFLSDGQGSLAKMEKFPAVFELLLAPPEGPLISSPSHPQNDLWYADSSPIFVWEKNQQDEGYSYLFLQNPLQTPDTVVLGQENFKSFENIKDGIWYFNLRAKRNGLWGKTSSFSAKIDKNPPDNFQVEIDNNSRMISFSAEDRQAGIDYFEVGFLDLNSSSEKSSFFTQANSPIKSPFESVGKYQVIIRVFDKAGNFQQLEKNFTLKNSFIDYSSKDAIIIGGMTLKPKAVFAFAGFFFIGGIFIVFYFLKRKGYGRGLKEIKEALEQIEKIKEKEAKAKESKERFLKEKTRFEEEMKDFN